METPLSLLTSYRDECGPHPKLNKAITLLYQQDAAIQKHKRLAKMINPEGFKELFYHTLQQHHCTHEQAFDLLNNEYHSQTEIYRYKNFDSFRKVKDR